MFILLEKNEINKTTLLENSNRSKAKNIMLHRVG